MPTPNKLRQVSQIVRAFLMVSCMGSMCGAAIASSAQLERVYQRSLQDPEFKALDEGLQAAYEGAMSALTESEQKALRQVQRQWIRENASVVAQDPQTAGEKLKERFSKRREELLRAQGKERRVVGGEKASPAGMEALPATAPQKALPALVEKPPAPSPPETGSTPPGVPSAARSQNAAENLERVYQKALGDPEFEAADSQLRSLYRKALGVLDADDAQKLRNAEKAWVKENGLLILPKPASEFEVLKARTVQRRDEVAQMLKDKRFIPAGAPLGVVPEKPVALALKLEEAIPVAPLQTEITPELNPKEETAPEPEVREPARSRIVAWTVLLVWGVMSVVFHFRAFKGVGDSAGNCFVRHPNSTKPYVFGFAGFCMAVSSALLVDGWIWPSVGGVIFSGLGLLFLKAAAVDAAGIAFDASSRTLEIPNGISRARIPVADIRRLEYPISVGKGTWELQIHTGAESWLLSFSARRKWDEAYALLQKFAQIAEGTEPAVSSARL